MIACTLVAERPEHTLAPSTAAEVSAIRDRRVATSRASSHRFPRGARGQLVGQRPWSRSGTNAERRRFPAPESNGGCSARGRRRNQPLPTLPQRAASEKAALARPRRAVARPRTCSDALVGPLDAWRRLPGEESRSASCRSGVAQRSCRPENAFVGPQPQGDEVEVSDDFEAAEQHELRRWRG
jgi:hypothetical protein